MDIMHVGLDLSRKRVDVCVLDSTGAGVEELSAESGTARGWPSWLPGCSGRRRRCGQ